MGGKHRRYGRRGELPLGCSPWEDLQQGDPGRTLGAPLRRCPSAPLRLSQQRAPPGHGMSPRQFPRRQPEAVLRDVPLWRRQAAPC